MLSIGCRHVRLRLGSTESLANARHEPLACFSRRGCSRCKQPFLPSRQALVKKKKNASCLFLKIVAIADEQCFVRFADSPTRRCFYKFPRNSLNFRRNQSAARTGSATARTTSRARTNLSIWLPSQAALSRRSLASHAFNMVICTRRGCGVDFDPASSASPAARAVPSWRTGLSRRSQVVVMLQGLQQARHGVRPVSRHQRLQHC